MLGTHSRNLCPIALNKSILQLISIVGIAKPYRRLPASKCCPVAGERRSADRTAWSQEQQAHASVPKQQYLEHAHEAVSSSDPEVDVASLLDTSAIHFTLPCCISKGVLVLYISNQKSPESMLQVWHAASTVAAEFQDIDLLVAHNLRRVQNAMRNARLGPHHFAGSTGYGHGDLGRSALDEVCCTTCPVSPLQC